MLTKAFILTMLIGTSLTTKPSPEPAPLKLSLMSYNVRNSIGMDNKRDYDRLVLVMKEYSPDVIALQELDSATGRSGRADVLKELAHRIGYNEVYAPAIDFDGGKYGIGILSKQKAIRSWSLPLPGREEKRVLQVVEFEKYIIFNTHFSLTAEDRISSVGIINEEMAKCRKPVFLAGDFNAEHGSAEIRALKENKWFQLSGTDFTFPADNPRACIDFIFSSVNYKVQSSLVVNAPMASDHRPVLLRINGKKNE